MPRKINVMAKSYKDSDKISDVICDEFHLLQMMCRFGIPLGCGEKSVKEVCVENHVDPNTFLAVANYMKLGAEVLPYYADKISVSGLIAYLKQAHSYFLDFQLPNIKRKLIEALDCSEGNEVALLILKFFDDYMAKMRRHMQLENKNLFSYVDQLLQDIYPGKFDITTYSKSHDDTDIKLQELKNLIIKYYNGPLRNSELLHSVLFDIFVCEADVRAHCEVEDFLFIPAIQLLEEKVKANAETNSGKDSNPANENALSEREREILVSVVKGMTNKEIADKLYISLNTVLTHRKNISRKLNIRSVSGLTIYAIVNNIISIQEVQKGVQ